MTERNEIERLLQMTGRTLEGLPEEYPSWAALETSRRVGNTSIKVGNMLLHQSEVIELLVGALRDALDKQPKWISVEEELPMVGQLVLTYLGGYTGDVIEFCSLDEFGG